MAMVKLEIDGRKVVADDGSTILEVARKNGIHDIPTLCHDDRLEPFASCFVCVVKVKGARTLLPACSTKVAAGMVVETDTADVRRARKASLELILSNHYADCIGPCRANCPAGVDIQGYVALAALGRYDEAIRLIKEANPLPAACGRVCTRPCEVNGCRRNMVDAAVGIDFIKRYVADVDLGQTEPFRPPLAPDSGRRVAVVGAGPAGLSCAYYLRTKGHQVALFEAMPEAGGMLRYGIPEYRLPKDVLDREIEQIVDLGVTLHTNTALGRDFTVDGLRGQGYDAVFLGLGAWDSSTMRIEAEDTPGVLRGIEFLKQFGLRRAPDLAGRVLVVGGGNTAIDCARTALRVGADEVRLLYRRTRTEMPANAMEIEEAELEGVHMDFLVAPVRVVAENGRVAGLLCQRMELGAPDASGRRSPKPVAGSEFVVPADVVIAAIGQSPQAAALFGKAGTNLLPAGESLALTRSQTIQADPGTFETSVEGVFSGGDVVTGAATAIEAIAAGRKAAHAIDAFLRTGKAAPEPAEFFSRKDAFRKVTPQDLRPGSGEPRRPMPMLEKGDRLAGFAEVELGYRPDELQTESERCLECGCSALFDCDLRRYATEYGADVKAFLGEAQEHRIDTTHPRIELDPNKCILCGRCVRLCSEVVGIGAYGFNNRGFGTVIRPALGGSLLETECVSCGMCIGTCPTGAIAEVSPLAKPGPWKTTATPTVCSFCGTGCRLDHQSVGDLLVQATPRMDGHAIDGNHCAKGRFGYDQVQSGERLRAARVGALEFPVDEAIRHAAARLAEIRQAHSGEAVAVFVSPRLSNEEAYLAQKLARVALGTHQVTTFARLLDPGCPEVVSTATYADLAAADAVLVVGSETHREHFVVDLLAKKALRAGGRMVYVGPSENRTSRFADVFLSCDEGSEPQVVQALLRAAGILRGVDVPLPRGIEQADLDAAVEVLAGAARKVLVFNKDRRGLRTAADERLYADAAARLGAGLLALREKANMQGLLDLGVSPDWLPGYVAPSDAAGVAALEREWCTALDRVAGAGADVARRLREHAIKAVVVLGEDPLGHPDLPADLEAGLRAAELLVVADLFPTRTAAAAHIALPLSATAETSGTMTSQERRVQRFARAVAPAGGIETWDLLARLGAALGYRARMKYRSADDVTAEIRRAVPLYAPVVVDSAGADGLWPLERFALARPAFDAAALPAPTPRPDTLPLDTVEVRFDQSFGHALQRARALYEALAASTAP